LDVLKKNGAVTMIFGKDYTKLNPTPILYMKENKIYSSDEYNKLFSTPFAYIKTDSAKNSNTTNSAKNNKSSDSVKSNKADDSRIIKILKMVLIILAIAFVSVAFVFSTLTEDITYVPVLLAAIITGFVFTFLISKPMHDDNAFASAFANISMNALYAEFASVVVFWIGIMIIDLPGSHGFSMFGTIFLSPILIAVMMAIPSIIIGLIVYGVKMLFKE